MALVAIWTRQYIRTTDISGSSRIHMTDERMTQIVNDAYGAGVSDGEAQGRVNFRRDIESGELPEVRKTEAAPARRSYNNA